MAPPKRRASIVAEATNKRIAAQQEEIERESMGMSMSESPLTSLGAETPSPPQGMGLGLGISMDGGRPETGESRSLLQQIQKVRRQGLDVEVGEGGLVVNGSGGGNGKKGGGAPKEVQGKEGLVMPSTPLNRGERGDGAKEGSTLKKMKVKKGMVAPSTPANSSGNGVLQKRSASAYLEDAPDIAEQEREHVRPAKRHWRVAMPPPFHPPASLVRQNQQRLREVLGDPVLFALTGPQYTADPNHADLSNFLEAEIHRQSEPPQREYFPGLPQYPVSRPGPPNAAYAPRAKPSTDSFGCATEHLKMLNHLKEQGFLLGEERTESHRLHTQFVKLMGDQRRDIYIKNNRPIDTEDYFVRQPPTPDFKNLALGKLKPARVRADPTLFGTWHHSKPMHEEDNQGCTFCMFECDYGVSDERVWLPVEASRGFCRACHEATMDSYHELDHLVDVRAVDDLEVEVQTTLNRLSIVAATPPLKELGDKMKFKEVASVFMSERARLSASSQTAACNVYEVANVGAPHQVLRAFNNASPRQSPSPIMRSAPASPQLPLAAFASMNAQQQQQFMMANGGGGVGNQASPQAWAAFLSGLGPEQRQFILMHLTGNARGQVSQIMQGGSGSHPLQGSMLNGGRPANVTFRRRLSNGTMVPVSSVDGDGAKNSQQAGQTINRPDASPFMQVHSTQTLHQRRLSNGSMLPTASQMSVNDNGTSSAQKTGLAANGPGGSPLMQLYGGQTLHQRRLSTGSMPPPFSSTSLNGNEIPSTQNTQQATQAANGLGGSPLMQPSMLIEAHNLKHRQRSLSNSSSTPAFSQTILGGSGPQNSQQIVRAVKGPGGSPSTQPLMLNGAHTPNQRRLSNSGNRSTISQAALNSIAPQNVEQIQQNRRPAVGVAGNSVALPKARNGAGSPLIEGPMLNDVGNQNNFHQRRLSNSGSRPAPPPQISRNCNGAPNMQQMAQANAKGSIALTRSGRVIAPTSIPNSAGAVTNASSRPQPNSTNLQDPANATIAQRRLSSSQMRRIIGPSGISPLRIDAGVSNTTTTRPHPSSSSPPTLANATINCSRNVNPQKTARNVNRNPPTQKSGPPMIDGSTSPGVPPQLHRRRLSNPPLMAPLGALPPTPRQSPTLVLSSSPILASSNLHAHPNPPTHLNRSQTAPLTPSDPMGPPPRPKRTISAIDGRETTIYQSLLFCRGSFWRQVDVRKARICEECKEEKFSITKHRHTKFYPLCEKRGLREGEGIGWGGVMGGEGKRMGCMVCTETATYGCEGCPLRLCVGCEVKLTMMCKGYLNNLIYMHGDRAHIRNDAFLLRSDGGGF